MRCVFNNPWIFFVLRFLLIKDLSLLITSVLLLITLENIIVKSSSASNFIKFTLLIQDLFFYY